MQQLLLEEAAKLTDAAVRRSIAEASGSALATGVANALRTPKRLAEQVRYRLDLQPYSA